MDWVIAVLLLSTGALIGFFAARHTKRPNQLEQDNQRQSDKEVFLQHASTHLEEVFNQIADVEKYCSAARMELTHLQSRIKTFSRDGEDIQPHFFGEQAGAYLRDAESQKEQINRQSTGVQPKDYSGKSSGLFQPESDIKKSTKTEA